jgi:pilus assembly protein Flp/PilA
MIKRFLKDESGVTMIEYGLIAALIGVVCIVVLTAIGTDLNGLFGTVSSELQKANP